MKKIKPTLLAIAATLSLSAHAIASQGEADRQPCAHPQYGYQLRFVFVPAHRHTLGAGAVRAGMSTLGLSALVKVSPEVHYTHLKHIRGIRAKLSERASSRGVSRVMCPSARPA